MKRMIKKTSGGKLILYSSDGRRKLSKPGTLAQIQKREKQVQFFKNLGKIRGSGAKIRKRAYRTGRGKA